MEIKQIKLSPKRGGNGFVSSCSINIGAREARDCFRLEEEPDAVFIKLLDPEARQIIIQPKRFTLTPQVLKQVCSHAELSLDMNRRLSRSPAVADPDTGVYRPSDGELLRQARAHDEVYYTYLLALPTEALTDLVTLMCMGRDKDVDTELPPARRFLSYWQQLEQYGSFTLGSDALAGQLMYNLELAEYLRKGLKLMELDWKI